MEVLRFRLAGKTAFFKIPEVNTFYYFTYGQIHKVALLGIFGAILGYKGYGQKYEIYPEFYEKLKDLATAVAPESRNGYFGKKIQSFNNSVGYASQEQGGNLIIKEQWLEEPSWTVYVLVQDEQSRKLRDAMLSSQCTYIPYLGKNDHPAELSNIEILHAEETRGIGLCIDSLFPDGQIMMDEEEGYSFKYSERLPVALKASTNQYVTQKMIYTDGIVEKSNVKIYQISGKNVVFF